MDAYSEITEKLTKYIKENISVSLGADGPPCNNNLSQFNQNDLTTWSRDMAKLSGVKYAGVIASDWLF